MSFSIRMTTDLVAVEAGVTVPVSFEIANRSEEQDQYEIGIEGLDPEWTAVPVPTFKVDAGEKYSEKFYLKPPRVSESLAGNYPFVLTVRSLESGESRTVQAVLQIKPYHHVSMEVLPKKGYLSPTKKQNSFEVTLMNLGNTPHTMQLFGNDPDEACAFEFDQEHVTLAPGQQKVVEVLITPTNKPLLSNARLYGISLSARSVETPSVVTSAQAQLEQRPLLTPGSLAFFAFVAIVAGLWIYLLPKPFAANMSVSRVSVTRGEDIVVSWRATGNAKRVTILANDEVIITDGPELVGSKTYKPTEAGVVTITAFAVKDGKKSPTETKTIQVNEPAPVPDPVIRNFDISPLTVKVGDPYTIYYNFNEYVTKAYLQPTGEELNTKLGQREFTATSPRKVEYQIVAENEQGKTVRSKTIEVVIEPKSQALITRFRASPSKTDPGGGFVTLQWQITGAAFAEILDGERTIRDISADNLNGSSEMYFDKSTTLTLRATDANRVQVTSTVKIEVPKRSEPELEPATSPISTEPPIGARN